MADQAKLKRAIRARMATTGEKYTVARRALLKSSATSLTSTAPLGDAKRPLPTWKALRELADQSIRPQAWRHTTTWALNVLESDLGPNWPVEAVAQGAELPIPLHLLAGHTLALVEIVALALRIQLLGSTPGFARTRNERRRNPEAGRIRHFALQANVAALARRLGWGLHLEPGSPPADLWFELDSNRITVETRILEPSDLAREHHDAVDRMMRRIRSVAEANGVWAYGDVSTIPSDEAIEDVLRWISGSAGFVRNRGVVQPYNRHGVALQLIPRGNAQGLALKGPIGGESLLPRFVRALGDKATRMQQSGAEWLCIENLTGLFGFTEWAQLDMSSKLASLESAIQEHIPSSAIKGVVVCSGVSHFNGTVNEETAETPGGSVGLRYSVEPWRAREVIIVPFDDAGATSPWRRLLDAERDWFPWALNAAGLPTFEEITADPS